MAFITVAQENSAAIELYYEDHGSGPPVVLIHGFPLDGHSWEKQEHALLAAGYRVITYDRRGFGQSSQPSVGFDYDTFAGDLDAVLATLDLEGAALVGFSMGTGEVTRFLSTYGSARVSCGVLVGPIPPFLLKTADNPEGVDPRVFEGIKQGILADRPAAMRRFLDDFFNVDQYRGTRISDDAWRAHFNLAVRAGAKATYDCVDAWLTDFRPDLAKIDVPLLVIQGDQDRILPYAATGERLRTLIQAEHVLIRGGPHAIGWTHADELNQALLPFLDKHLSPEKRGAEEEPAVH